MKSPSRAAAAPAPVIPETFTPSVFRWLAARPQLIFLLLPAILFWMNPNWPFQGLGHMDPWYYFGNIQHFPKYHNLFPAYYGERMTWIAPGVLFVHLFGPVAGVVLLHVATYTLSLFLFHGILKTLTDARTALCATLLLGCHPFFIGANGWDYIDGASLTYQLLSLACIVRSRGVPDRWVFFSAVAWTCLIYNYLAWAAFTPGYLFLLVWPLRKQPSLPKLLVRTAALAGSGFVATAVLLWAIYHGLGGKGTFYALNLRAAFRLSSLEHNPWLQPGWIKEAYWLIFPSIGFAVAVLAVARRRFGRLPISDLAWQFLVFYLYCCFVMLVLTFRQTRILGFDYFASILIPGTFLALGICLYHVPRSVRAPAFYCFPAFAAALCLIPLLRPQEYMLTLHWQAAVVIGPLTLAAGLLRWRWPQRGIFWAMTLLALSLLSFGLVPTYPGLAWKTSYSGWDSSARVAEGLRLLSLHLPKDKYPAFWFDDYTRPQTAEYRGIWCGFHSGPSMIHFPEMDPEQHFPPGTPLVVMDDHEDTPPAAAYRLARAGTPAAFRRSDRISRGSQTYWLHYFEMLPATPGNLRDGFAMTRQIPIDRPAAIGSGTGIYQVAGVDLQEPGIYQFELRSGEGPDVKFGSWTKAGWQNRSALPFHDGAATISWFRQVVAEPGHVDLAIQLDQDSAPAMNNAAIVLLRQAPPPTGMQTPYWPDAMSR